MSIVTPLSQKNLGSDVKLRQLLAPKSAVLEMANKVREMIVLSVAALQSRDKNAAAQRSG